MITIKDIAREADVSTGTVDRVLHNRGGVSPKTERKIRDILKLKKFKINLIASSLAMKKDINLSILIPKFDNQNLFWKSPFSGIKKAAQEVNAHGVETNIYSFDQFDPNNYLEKFKKLIETNPDALILVPIFKKETAFIIDKIEKKGIPYLFFNINQEGYNNLCYIGQKSFKAGYLSGELLKFCTPPKSELLIVITKKKLDDFNSINQRVKGFYDFFDKNNEQFKIHSIQFDNLTNIKSAEKKINNFLESNNKLKGIVVPSSRLSNVISVINDDLSKDLRFVGFDTTPNNVSALRDGKISFLISQKSFNQGYKSILTMVNFLIHKERPEIEIPTPLEIVTKGNVEFIEYDKRRYQNQV